MTKNKMYTIIFEANRDGDFEKLIFQNIIQLL